MEEPANEPEGNMIRLLKKDSSRFAMGGRVLPFSDKDRIFQIKEAIPEIQYTGR